MAKLKDVANLAGVSVTTVSRVLNRAPGIERIPSACIGRVEEAAKSLGYGGNYLARSLQTGRSEGIGVAALSSAAPYSPRDAFGTAYIAAVYAATRGAGYHVVTVGPARDLSAAAWGVSFLKEQRIDALIVPEFEPSVDDLHILESSRAPIVIIGKAAQTPLPVVELDHRAGIVAAVSHLAELNHRCVAWVGPKQAWAAADIRQMAFHAEMSRRGLHAESIHVDLPRTASNNIVEIAATRAEVCGALKERPGISALICYNDMLALGALRAIADAGLRVPQDISVIGFDDIFGEVSVPPLTTISHMINEMSVQGIDCVLEMLNDAGAWERLRGRRYVVQPQLIIRESTARKS